MLSRRPAESIIRRLSEVLDPLPIDGLKEGRGNQTRGIRVFPMEVLCGVNLVTSCTKINTDKVLLWKPQIEFWRVVLPSN
jgi:hypothetical protein